MANKKIFEDITKSEINSLIDLKLNSNETEKKIKDIISDVLNEFFKTLYQRNNFWKNTIKR